jgi:hypothetical protein
VSPPPPAPGQPPQGGKPGDKKPAPPARPAAPGARPPAQPPKPGAPGASGVRPAGAPPPTGARPAPGKPAPGKPAPGKPAPGRPAPPPPPKKDPNLIAGGKFFEVRKGRARTDDEEEDESAGDDFAVELPRSIGKVEEEEDLKRRFDREALPDIDERHAAVKVTDVPATMARRAGGKWVLVILAILLLAGVGTTFKTQILDFLKKQGLVSGK